MFSMYSSHIQYTAYTCISSYVQHAAYFNLICIEEILEQWSIVLSLNHTYLVLSLYDIYMVGCCLIHGVASTLDMT